MRRRIDKIDCNIYELKSSFEADRREFKEFRETVVGFIDSLTKWSYRDSPTGRSYKMSKF